MVWKNKILRINHDSPANIALEEKVLCPLCDGGRYELVRSHKIGSHVAHKLLCQDCGLVYTEPLPEFDELKKIYAKRSSGQKPNLKHAYRSAIRALPRFNRIRNLLKDNKELRIVDVGARTGEFLYLLQNKGYKACGIESNKEFIKHAAKEYNLDLDKQYIDEITLPEAEADMITCYHILHLSANPLLLLKRLHRALKVGGYLNLEVPNIEAKHRPTQQKLKAKNLHMFNIHTLHAIAKSVGFTVKNTILIPGTLHINVILKKEWRANDVPACLKSSIQSNKNYLLVRDHVLGYRSFDYLISSAPYSKLLNKIKRQFREFKVLWPYSSAKQVVNSLFGRKI